MSTQVLLSKTLNFLNQSRQMMTDCHYFCNIVNYLPSDLEDAKLRVKKENDTFHVTWHFHGRNADRAFNNLDRDRMNNRIEHVSWWCQGADAGLAVGKSLDFVLGSGRLPYAELKSLDVTAGVKQNLAILQKTFWGMGVVGICVAIAAAKSTAIGGVVGMIVGFKVGVLFSPALFACYWFEGGGHSLIDAGKATAKNILEWTKYFTISIAVVNNFFEMFSINVCLISARLASWAIQHCLITVFAVIWSAVGVFFNFINGFPLNKPAQSLIYSEFINEPAQNLGHFESMPLAQAPMPANWEETISPGTQVLADWPETVSPETQVPVKC